MTRPTEEAARAAIEAWLEQRAPGYPDYSHCTDGEDGWAFWVADQDTTSYLHHDLKIEWYGTGWPSRYEYDEMTGTWSSCDPAITTSGTPIRQESDVPTDVNDMPEGEKP